MDLCSTGYAFSVIGVITMENTREYGIIEKISWKLKLLPTPKKLDGKEPDIVQSSTGELEAYPPMEKWNNWTEYEAKYWPLEVTK